MTTYRIENPSMMILPCIECGIYFGLSEGLYEIRYEDGEAFYCPSGHKQSFVAEEEKVKQGFSAKEYADNAMLKSQVEYLSRKLREAEVALKTAKSVGIVSVKRRAQANGKKP